MSSCPGWLDTGSMTLPAIGAPWIDAIDISEHHCIDFDTVAEQDTGVVIVRAGRGTRQDARWIEHVRAARRSGLHVGSYWHLYPSRTDPHHQAELWAAAVRTASTSFSCGHWADITSTDGLDRNALRRYLRSFLRRIDALLDEPVGVFTSATFWDEAVALDLAGRPRWSAEPTERSACWGPDGKRWTGARTRPSDRGGPGSHRVHWAAPKPSMPRRSDRPHLVVRHADETPTQWRERWMRGPAVVDLQEHLNDLGASLVVDGAFGPETEAAAKTLELLRRRDRVAADVGCRTGSRRLVERCAQDLDGREAFDV